MRKVAIFGNTGGGKSTLARKLALRTRLPLHALDKICYAEGGAAVPPEVYAKCHQDLLNEPEWIIEGYGSHESLWTRLSEADTLIYIDLPLPLHLWWVTKRFITGIFVAPEGWPKRSPLLRSTLSSYRVLWLCHRHLTPKYRAYISTAAESKQVFHLRSRSDVAGFLREVNRDRLGRPP